jgi:hypothetical protein
VHQEEGKDLAIHFAENNWNVIATMICLDQGKEPIDKQYQLLSAGCTNRKYNCQRKL